MWSHSVQRQQILSSSCHRGRGQTWRTASLVIPHSENSCLPPAVFAVICTQLSSIASSLQRYTFVILSCLVSSTARLYFVEQRFVFIDGAICSQVVVSVLSVAELPGSSNCTSNLGHISHRRLRCVRSTVITLRLVLCCRTSTNWLVLCLAFSCWCQSNWEQWRCNVKKYLTNATLFEKRTKVNCVWRSTNLFATFNFSS